MKLKINNKKVLALATVVLLGMTSCKKELNLLPTDSFTEDKAFLNIADVQAGVNTVYARMGACSGNLYSSALLSDEAKLGAGNSGQGALTYRYQYNADGTTGGDVIGAWSSFSSALYQINTVLPYIDKVPGDADVKKDLRGQLLALRAICHFYLMQSYCGRYNPTAAGIPIITYVDIFAKPARNTMGQVMTQMETDMTTAQGLLSTTAGFSDLVINKTNLTAFQAKVALYKGDYQAAVDFSTTVINSGVKPLVSGTAYSGIWTDANQQELLFRVAYNNSAAIGGMWTTLGNDVYIAPSDKLTAAYGTGDNRKAIFIGTVGGNRFVKKYEKSSRGGLILDLKVMRIAEIYLIRAEAYAKLATPNLIAGTADLNAVRAKRITPAATSGVAPANANDLVTAVMDERFRELCFEGFRFFDLKRNYMSVNRLASDASSAWQNLDKDNFRFTLPVPYDEILANPNMVQNPGY